MFNLFVFLAPYKKKLCFHIFKLVSHCHANFSRLFCEFCRATFARHSCECRENFLVSRTGREVFPQVEKFYANFFSKIFRIVNLPKFRSDKFATLARTSRDRRTTVARVSRECRELVAAKFWQIYNAKFSRHSYECRAIVARRSRDSLAKTSRLSSEKIN